MRTVRPDKVVDRRSRLVFQHLLRPRHHVLGLIIGVPDGRPVRDRVRCPDLVFQRHVVALVVFTGTHRGHDGLLVAVRDAKFEVREITEDLRWKIDLGVVGSEIALNVLFAPVAVEQRVRHDLPSAIGHLT